MPADHREAIKRVGFHALPARAADPTAPPASEHGRVSTKKEVREFLISRRAKITPEKAGIIRIDEDQPMPGLRRREVAELAGVSLNCYSRLEQGYIRGVSASVLNAVADALHLGEAERKHLFDLARRAPAPQGTPNP